MIENRISEIKKQIAEGKSRCQKKLDAERFAEVETEALMLWILQEKLFLLECLKCEERD